jgi:hypothetical protein
MTTMSNQNIDARILAHRILQSLCDSSLATEFQEFRFEVQQELKLSDEEMKIYDFQNVVELLRPIQLPRRHFKGREVRREAPPVQAQEEAVPPPGVIDLSEMAGKFQKMAVETKSRMAQRREVAETFAADVASIVGQLTRLREESPVEQAPAEQAVPQEEKTPEAPVEREVEQVPVPQEHLAEVSAQLPSEKTSEAPQALTEAPVEVIQEPAEEEDSDGTAKNRHPAAKALRKLLRNSSIPLTGLRMDTDQHANALMLYGDTKQYKGILSTIGGRWSQRAGCWVFHKEKLIKAFETARRKSEEALSNVKPVPVEVADS